MFRRARQLHLLDDPAWAIVDATGFETGHVSRYFLWRRGTRKPGSKYPSWPKLTVVCHCQSHLWVAAQVDRGPCMDSPAFSPTVMEAALLVDFDRVLADAAFDSEDHHAWCREWLGIRSTVIPWNPRRHHRQPKTRYRKQMALGFLTRIYHQRWQVESSFSRHKRRLGSFLRSLKDSAREWECLIRVLTHNLMILGGAA